MSFVPDPNPGPRVLPKVFADVPSANELADARAEVAAARSGRNLLLLVVVLLVGMLSAAGVGLYYFEGQTRTLPLEISRLEEEKAALVKQVAELNDEIDDVAQSAEDAIAEYSIIDQRLKKNEELRAKISAVIEKKPSAIKVRKPALGTDDSHTAYEDHAWLPLRAQAEEKLGEETKELEQILADVEAYKPPRRGDGGFDPR